MPHGKGRVPKKVQAELFLSLSALPCHFEALQLLFDDEAES